MSGNVHDDAALLGCVTSSGAIYVDRVLAFVEYELSAVYQSRPESQLESGVLEQLKAKVVIT